MPLYLYQHPKTKEVKEVLQRMNEVHEYVDAKGLKWERIFTKPQAAMNTQFSATSSEEFIKKTKGKNYSIGQLWDISAELSEKRGGATGQDEVRHKAEESYQKKTGKKHPHSKKKDTTFLV